MVTRHVTLVTGPPCAGKSWHVDHHAQPGDLIVCMDQLAQAAGSPRRHQHQPEHWAAAQAQYLQHLAELHHHPGTAWIIATAADPDERQHLADQTRADTVLVLLPSLDAALARATHDQRHRRTHTVIRGWYQRYRPRQGDQVITTGLTTSRRW